MKIEKRPKMKNIWNDVFRCFSVKIENLQYLRDLEHVSRGALLNEMTFTKFKVGQPIRSRKKFFTADTWRHAVTLTFGPLTSNVCILLPVTRSNSVPNCNEIE